MEEVIVFGIGKYYQSKKEVLQSQYHIIAFLDNSVSKENEIEMDGRKVYHPSHVKLLNHVPILLMSVKFWEMAQQLKEYGVSTDRMKVGLLFQPHYDEMEQILSRSCVSDIHFEKLGLCLNNKQKVLLFEEENKFKAYLREVYKDAHPEICSFINLPTQPVSRRFSRERGTPIDRYYIEKFLQDNSSLIHGDVVEISENTYTLKYGKDLKRSYIMHVNGVGEDSIKGNLETGEGIRENFADCLICTQTIQFIYDQRRVSEHIYKMLKPGGTALITVPGISQLSMVDYSKWGEFWRFTDMSLKKIFEDDFAEHIHITTYGNVKTACSFLYGLCLEDLNKQDFEDADPMFPMIMGVVLSKKA